MGLLDNLSDSEMMQLAGLFAAMPTFSRKSNPVQPFAQYWSQAGEREKAEQEKQRKIKRQEEADARERLLQGRQDEEYFRGLQNRAAAQGIISANAGGRGLLDNPSQNVRPPFSVMPEGDANMPSMAYSENAPANPQRMQQELMQASMSGNDYATKALAAQMAGQYNLGKDQVRFDMFNNPIASNKSNDSAGLLSDIAKGEDSLRKEFANLTNNYADQNDAFGLLLSSAQRRTPAGDMAVIINYQKTLDPPSVVKEDEFKQAAAAGKFGDRIQAGISRVLSGQLLTEDQRQDFIETARNMYKESTRIFNTRKSFYENLAKQRNYDPRKVVYNRTHHSLLGNTSNSGKVKVDY